MPNRLRIVAALAMLAGACASSQPTTTANSPSTTNQVASTTAAPTTTPVEPGSGSGAERFGIAPVASALGIGDDYFTELGNPGYDVDHYTLDLVFDPATVNLSGIATIRATALEQLTSFNLDFTTMEPRSVLVDDRPAPFAAASEDITIQPEAPIAAGETFVVDVEYGGTPTAAASSAVPFGIGWTTVGNQNYVVAEPDAAHSWFPSNDHPLDKATFTFRITVPSDVVAAANGTLVDQVTDLGQTTWVWELASPMAPYLATVVIGDFVIVEDAAGSATAGVPIRHVLPAGTDVSDWPGLERQGEMIAFLSDLFGPYPFATYGIAVVDGFGAALENQTLSLFDSNLASSFFFEDVLVHELAHQWFGDSVSLARWGDIWLNEGFASYAEWLWIEREQGSAKLENEIAAERERFVDSGLPAPGVPPSFDLFNASVYRVGAMTLHALRLTVGDDAFFETLKTYASQFANQSATTADFIAIAEAVSGMELDELFDAWLIEPVVPEFPTR